MKALERIAECERLAEEATSGPWSGTFFITKNNGSLVASVAHSKDGPIIAASRTAVPELCRIARIALEALEQRIEDERHTEQCRCMLCEALEKINTAKK